MYKIIYITHISHGFKHTHEKVVNVWKLYDMKINSCCVWKPYDMNNLMIVYHLVWCCMNYHYLYKLW